MRSKLALDSEGSGREPERIGSLGKTGPVRDSNEPTNSSSRGRREAGVGLRGFGRNGQSAECQ